MNEITQWKHRIKTDVLDPIDKIKLDEKELKAEAERAGVDYGRLKKTVQFEQSLQAERLRVECETILEYLDA